MQGTDTELPARLRTAVGRLARRLQRAGAVTSLTPTESAVLLVTARRGPIGLSRVADEEGLHATALSRVVQRLEALELVARRRDPNDGRAATISLTPAGRQLAERIIAERTGALRRVVDGLSEVDRASLAAAVPLLERIAREIADAMAVQAGRMPPPRSEGPR